MKMRIPITCAILLMAACTWAAVVPLELARPDGKPGNMSKPVKVYILAGQSNMFGFGNLGASNPPYSGIMLSSDPNLIPGVFARRGMPTKKLARHGMYQEATGDTRGAKVEVFQGAYDPAADYSVMASIRQAHGRPVKETAVALGTVSETLPSIDGPHTVVAKAYITVPETGTYKLHAGYKSSACNVIKLDGKDVYRKAAGEQPAITAVELTAGQRYPITVTYAKGGSAAFWIERINLEGKGDLTTLTTKEGKFPWLLDDEGNWAERSDVIYVDSRTKKEAGGLHLSPLVNGRGDTIGPEVQFGYVMGMYHDEQVLLVESSMGNRALNWDFRPPSSGKTDRDGAEQWEGLEYRLLVEGVRETLNKIDTIVPGYAGQGYEIVGFAWWQGHKDSGQTKAQYEGHLVNLIQDLRKDLNAPDMRAVVATVGFHGWNLPAGWQGVFDAQMAVGDPKQHPEFSGKVASVDTRGFWRSADQSPKSVDYHYNLNAETYMLTGDALGRAMVHMLGGKVEMPTPPEQPPAVEPSPEPTESALAAHKTVIEPMIVDGMLADYLTDGWKRKQVIQVLTAPCPKSFSRRWNQFLDDSVDTVVSYFREIGITQYDWHDFGPEIWNDEWQYFSFEPTEETESKKVAGNRDVTVPEGMENWMSPAFDTAVAGWKTGKGPFGQFRGEQKPMRASCDLDICRCSQAPGTLWEHKVLMMRKTVTFPPLKEGHRYRIVVGGSAHVNAGEAYELYANGKLLGRSPGGVGKKRGAKPRGAHIYTDVRDAFNNGPVTLAVKSFLRYTHPREKESYPRGHISIWVQEQRIPDVLLDMLAEEPVQKAQDSK